MKLVVSIVVCIVLISSFVALLSVPIRTDWAFVCENTGSRYGYTEWKTGARTANWFKQSPLETFMARSHPDRLQHRWTSYAGTSKNLLGRNLSYVHGFPGPIFGIPDEVVALGLTRMSDDQKLAVYENLAMGNRTHAQSAIDALLGLEPEPASATNRAKNPFD
ncbi:MAG TPA: hypothetical protein VLT36_16315 [Candidatus Dormibacteraeota bacterium]|nr:hypothetical protein [Candidatus Dormibacteraeota bacterium]